MFLSLLEKRRVEVDSVIRWTPAPTTVLHHTERTDLFRNSLHPRLTCLKCDRWVLPRLFSKISPNQDRLARTVVQISVAILRTSFLVVEESGEHHAAILSGRKIGTHRCRWPCSACRIYVLVVNVSEMKLDRLLP